MRLTEKTRIDALLKTYPFLLDFLVTLTPKFSKLKNPIIRKTVGKRATVRQAAGLGDMDREDLLTAVAGEIRKLEGQKRLLDWE